MAQRSLADRLPHPAYVPALVLCLIISAAAALFAASYCVAMANPTPHRLPIGTVGESAAQRRLVPALEQALHNGVVVKQYATRADALAAVDAQRVFALTEAQGPGGVRFTVVPAAGASMARVLVASVPKAGAAVGVPVTLAEVKPLQSSDPQGLAIFYVSLAAVILGFVGAIQLSVHARALKPLERVAFTAGYAVLAGFGICATVDWGLHVLRLPFVESWGILSLTLMTAGMVFTMFNTLIGRWAMLPTWGLMVLLGNPSSGGAVSWPLLPAPLGVIGRWLPAGASVNAQHTAIYFHDHQYAFPFLVLTGWLVLALAVFLVWQERHPGGR